MLCENLGKSSLISAHYGFLPHSKHTDGDINSRHELSAFQSLLHIISTQRSFSQNVSTCLDRVYFFSANPAVLLRGYRGAHLCQHDSNLWL